ncbi:MAG: hypothetical protein AABM33_14935 [Pseudomonadota bacterium]
MHSAIVVVGLPDDDRTWKAFIARAELGEGRSAHVSQISENVWQVNTLENLSALSRILGEAERLDFFYKILVFDAEPQWLAGNPIRKT